MNAVLVSGGGPAGSAAALAALSEGKPVRIFEKSRFPRHKVCGEFLSPEIAPILEGFGAWRAFQAAGPARIGTVKLHLGNTEKQWRLPDVAFGLSRYALDRLLLDRAVSSGAVLIREMARALPGPDPAVLAYGRDSSTSRSRGARLFGFKAHFKGPVDDAVEVFFFSDCYVGVSAVENGLTNICGLAPETLLRAHAFKVEAVLAMCHPLGVRLRPLTREMEWLITGPVVFRQGFDSLPPENIYPAGDALGFIDPFTGSGILAALRTGTMAGMAAARETPNSDHIRNCRQVLGGQYATATLLRAAIRSGLAEKLARFVPGRLVFQLTRPRLVQ